MVTMRTEATDAVPKSNPNPEMIKENPKVSNYEQCREERIKENLQRMQNLGILNLSLKLKSETRPAKRHYGNPNLSQRSTPPLQPSRRSSRLENSTPVIYNDGIDVKGKEKSTLGSVLIREGTRPEIYTEEDEKLLGNTERIWTCFVDGYDRNGKRIYDPFKGKTCHQCRQKTLGHRTKCSECEIVRGQFCGDCLYMRYGEHVLEALENPNWICPVCRGICNCSVCRTNKGWLPTGPIYKKSTDLGYKSVAHYLIQTRREPQTDDEDDDANPNQASAKRSLSFQEAKQLPKIADDEDLPDEEVLKLQNGDSLKKEEDENMNENPNSAKRSLSFFLLSVDDDQTPMVLDSHEQSKLEKQEHSCAHISDDLPKIAESNMETRPVSYLLPVDDQTPVFDVQGLYSVELPKQEEQEQSCAHIGDDRPKTQDSNMETRPVSYLLPVDDQTPLFDVQVLYSIELPKQDEQEQSCAHIGDDLPKIQDSNMETRPVSYLLPVDDQTSLLDVQVSNSVELPKQDTPEHSCAHIGDDLPIVQARTGQDSSLDSRPEENQTLVVTAQNQVLLNETETKGNKSVSTRVTRRKRKAAPEPNPDSIGGRLRQRRKSQNWALVEV